jgi:glutamine synthetase
MSSTNNDYSSALASKHGFSNIHKELDDIEFLQIRYTDVPGKFLACYLLKGDNNIEDLFRQGIGLDGSSVKGFADISESDLILLPDRSTIRIINRTTTIPDHNIATVIANVYKGFGQGRLTKDPRHVSQCMEGYLEKNGLSCQIGAEVECFIFDDIIFQKNSDQDGKKRRSSYLPKIISEEQYGTGKYPIRRKDGYDAPPFQDSLLEFRFEVAEILKKCFSIKVTNLIHEVASDGQIEINFMHSSLTNAADNVQTYKDVVRNVAKKHNKVANFMPKPIFDDDENDGGGISGDNGSGMHTSVSLWDGATDNTKNKTNIFYDENDGYAELSQAARYFVGGILEHARSLAAFVTPTVNSYYRMVPGFEAPVYIAWARGNRSAVIRVPVDAKNNFKSKRIEFRAPDPSANPYLAFSAIVAAGLDGIKRRTDPGSSVDENIYKMSDSKRNSLGIKSLPASLEESLQVLRSDSNYLKTCFHSQLIETYTMLKEEEIIQVGKDKSKPRQFMFYYDV